MKVRIARDRLVEGITWAARALPARPVVPALAALRLEAAGGTLAISAYNHEVSAGIEVAAAVDRPGEILVPGRLLAEIARSLPREHSVELVVEPHRARVTCAGSYFTLPLPALADYPATPLFPDLAGTVAASVFAEGVAQVAIAAARDETVPVLTAIRMGLTHDGLILAATDRYRLAVRRLPWRSVTEDPTRSILAPARVLAELARYAGTGGGDLRLALGAEDGRHGLLGLAVDRRQATTRLLDYEFPGYERLFDNEVTGVATIDTAALIEALRRVSPVVTRNTPVRLSFGRDSLRIEAGSTDEAEAGAALPVELTGEPTRAAFNPAHLLDGLSALRSPSARMSFGTTGRPTVLTEGSDRADHADQPNGSDTPDYRYLLMPMRGA
ncbi:DNA polymerase III subunit beta [Embleya sp. AB8]|uniref:DNA polymerase III subunit beta n=1 Tax=Embleya sp. AB8 TaxID=3156304 RepID=UPI003C743284